ncbi:tetratricopeptide repeat protein 33 [Protopterus annectens]|uniref:tetratricopeptide repeat protein 33 n=1 Tax=Protopterus annectens TaxID=7888 RepID=UPI001CFB1131|nr:tetratricopeptide repeat protein 33 [Protopterus annectens]
MASFGWKRKIGEKVSKVTSKQFESEAAEEGGVHRDDEVDWLHACKRRKEILLEDCADKSKRLKDEGSLLAESGRHQEAVGRWDEAIQLTPEDAALYEMKAQVLMLLNEAFLAVQAAEMAVQRSPRWWMARQTLGRAQLGIGEVMLALKSFQVALHINPSESTLWKDDLAWALQLREQQKEAERLLAEANAPDLGQKAIPDFDFESDEVIAACAAIAEKQKHTQKTTILVSSAGNVETITQKNETTTDVADAFVRAR